MLMNKEREVRKHTSCSETRGSVYFILLYSAFKTSVQNGRLRPVCTSGPFSAPTEMGVNHHVGCNSDIARASVCGCVSLF